MQGNEIYGGGAIKCCVSEFLPLWKKLRNGNNVAKFNDRLANVHWDELSESKNTDCTYRCFVNKYTTIYNDCFPLKKVKVKNVTLSKPWITKGLLKSVRKKNLLYKRFLANPTSYREKLYKSYKNKLTHSLRVAKRLYYNKKLDEYKSNAKSTWKLLNDLINKKKIKCKLPSIFKSNEEEIFNPTHIANRFCEYFTNIGPNLAKSIPASDKSHRSFLNGGFINSFFLQAASEQEVTEICRSFRSGTAPGYMIVFQ